MATQVSASDLSKSVLDFIQNGNFPESEDVTSADISSHVLEIVASLTDTLKRAQNDVRSLSRKRGAAVDKWIADAKALQSDIVQSKTIASQILEQAKQEGAVNERYHDASTNATLRRKELAYNEQLVEALQSIQYIHKELSDASDATSNGSLRAALDAIKRAEEALEAFQAFSGLSVVASLMERRRVAHDAVQRELFGALEEMVAARPDRRSIYINRASANSTRGSIELDDVVMILDEIGELNGQIDHLCDVLETNILQPLMQSSMGKAAFSIDIKRDNLQLSQRTGQGGVAHATSQLLAIFKFLVDKLPQSLEKPLMTKLVSQSIVYFKDIILSSMIPANVDELDGLHLTTSAVSTFADDVSRSGWAGADELEDWLESLPRLWLSKKREGLLDGVRQILAKSVISTRIVERTETQKITSSDDILASTQADDWNANWSDDEDEVSGKQLKSDQQNDEDQDVSAWGFDDEEPEDSRGGTKEETEDDEEDAWGAWGDEDEQQKPAGSKDKSEASKKITEKPVNGHIDSEKSNKEITLRETFAITNIPDQTLSIITDIVKEGDLLSQSSEHDDTVAPAAPGLFQFPTLALAMYRAVAPVGYEKHPVGGMHMYNDTIWLAEQLREFQSSRADQSTSRPLRKVQLDTDISGLERFAKRAYSKEMESQRRILADLLDGAQGFANCTDQPYSSACDDAIASTIDRIQSITKLWEPVLSKSALLQSVGSLMGSVTSKIIIDVEDLSDISEVESQQLSTYFSRMAELETIFLPDQPQDTQQEAVPLTAVYCPTWLKFQYLSNILESTLVDIKFMWTEGELSLEFSAEEVIDLIQALFADSEHRRRAIGEIRRSSNAHR